MAAFHPLSQSPNPGIIVKFIHHADRDIVWHRKSWLNGYKSRYGYANSVEECLAPRHRFLKQETKNIGLETFTRNQDVCFQRQPAQLKTCKNYTEELTAFVTKRNVHVRYDGGTAG